MITKTTVTTKQLVDLIRYVPETGEFIAKTQSKKRKEGTRIGTKHGGTIRMHVANVYFEAHKLAAWLVLGREPAARVVAINGDKTDLRWSNLHVLTPREAAQAAAWKSAPPRIASGRLSPQEALEMKPPKIYEQTEEEKLAPAAYAAREAQVEYVPGYDALLYEAADLSARGDEMLAHAQQIESDARALNAQAREKLDAARALKGSPPKTETPFSPSAPENGAGADPLW